MQACHTQASCRTSVVYDGLSPVRLPGIRDLFPDLLYDSPPTLNCNTGSPPLLHIAACTPRPELTINRSPDAGYFPQNSSPLSTSHPPHVVSYANGTTTNNNSNTKTSKSRKHVCPECHKRFNRPSSLSIHLHTHTGERPYTCPHPGCLRTFNVSSNMRRHFRSHETDNGGHQFSSFSFSPSPSPTSSSPCYSRQPVSKPY